MEKQFMNFMNICQKSEKSKKLNPMMRNLFCEDVVSNYKKGLMDKNNLKWSINWYKKSLKDGDFDWDEYNEHHKKSKRKNNKRKTNKRRRSRTNKRRSRTNKRRTNKRRRSRTNKRRTLRKHGGSCHKRPNVSLEFLSNTGFPRRGQPMDNMGSILEALSPKHHTHHRPQTTSSCDGKRPNEYFNMKKRLGNRTPKRQRPTQLLDNPEQLLRMLGNVTPKRRRPKTQHLEMENQLFDMGEIIGNRAPQGSSQIFEDLTPKCRKHRHNKTIQLSPLIMNPLKGKKKKKKKERKRKREGKK